MKTPSELNKIIFFSGKKWFCDVVAVMVGFDLVAGDALRNSFWKGFIIVTYFLQIRKSDSRVVHGKSM